MSAIVHCMCQTPVNVALSFGKRQRLKQQRRQFNATSTYARFSDIPTPYFAGACRRDANVVDRRMTSISDRLHSKDRAVAWFATHCWTSSKRERYNTAQNKHIYLVCDAELLLSRCSHVIAQYVVLTGTRRQAKANRMTAKSQCTSSCCIHAHYACIQRTWNTTSVVHTEDESMSGILMNSTGPNRIS